MNILLLCKRRYINKDLIVDRFGRHFHFPMAWTEMGHRVTVVAADYRSSAHVEQEVAGVDFHTLGFPSFGIDFYLRLRSLARSRSPALVIASGDSHFGFIGSMLARNQCVPFVFDLYHHYADFGSNRMPGMKRLYFASLRRADLVVCDSPTLQDKISPYSSNSCVASQGTDPAVFKPLPKAACVTRLGLNPRHRYIGYTGAMDARFDYDCLLGALQDVRAQMPEVRLLVAGPNLMSYDLERDDVHYLGEMPQDEIPIVINACDVVCIPYKNTALASTCNPSKLSEYIACGAPVIASRVSNVTDYLPVSRHLSHEPGDSAQLAKSLLIQLVMPIVESYDPKMTWRSIGAHYLEALKCLTDRSVDTPHDAASRG